MDIQTGGSVAVIGAFAVSEASASLLEAHPGSALAWYLNAGMFRAFECARVEMLPSRFLFGPAALPIALTLLILLLFARKLRFRLGVAAFANMSFAGAAMVAYAAFNGTVLVARWDEGQQGGLLLAALLLVVSFWACAASHWSFCSAIVGHRQMEAGPELARAASSADRGILRWLGRGFGTVTALLRIEVKHPATGVHDA